MPFGVNKVNRVNSYFAAVSLCEMLFINFIIYNIIILYIIIFYSTILIIVMDAKITVYSVYLVYLTMAVAAFCGRFKKMKMKKPLKTCIRPKNVVSLYHLRKQHL